MVEQWRGEGDGAKNRSYHRLVNDVMQVWGKFRARLNHSLLGLTPAAINSLDIILTTVVDSSGTDQRDGLTTLHGCCFFLIFIGTVTRCHLHWLLESLNLGSWLGDTNRKLVSWLLLH